MQKKIPSVLHPLHTASVEPVTVCLMHFGKDYFQYCMSYSSHFKHKGLFVICKAAQCLKWGICDL